MKRLAFMSTVVMFALVGFVSATGSDTEPSQRTRQTKEPTLRLELRSRRAPKTKGGEAAVETRKVRWEARKTAIIICDMWDDHTCKGAARRVGEMAPAVDRTVKAARRKGVFIIHAPSGTMSLYKDTPQRKRALEAPRSKAPVDIKWNHWNKSREGEPPTWLVNGGCACRVACANFAVDEHGIRRWKRGGKLPWTRQIKSIEIAPEDAISDSGQEIYNLLQERHIDNVILMGVHTNICVSGRPFGLRQMSYFGKNVVLCRDLTDALFQSKTPGIGQFQGTDLVVQHIETRICPSMTSSSITGQPAFRFHGARRSE